MAADPQRRLSAIPPRQGDWQHRQIGRRYGLTAFFRINHPVVDLTGLKGAYDFALSYNGAGRVRALTGKPAEGGQPAGAVPAAAEPALAITVFEAVDKQLGLKLAEQKHPMPVIVIDHVDRTPTEN
jgi:uncharacterized protein (TIGR03435 family)